MSTAAKPNKWREMAKTMYAQKELDKKNPQVRKPLTQTHGQASFVQQSGNASVMGSNNNGTSTSGNGGGQPQTSNAQFTSSMAGFRGRKPFVAPSVAPILLSEFLWADTLYLPRTTGKVKLVPLRNPSNQPLCLKLVGGGSIPSTIGLSVNDYGKSRLTFTCNSAAERAALERMHDDATASCINFVKEWFPEYVGEIDPSQLFGRFLSEVKPKKDGGGEYPQLSSVNVNEPDLYSTDSRNEPDLIIHNEENKNVFNLPDLLGQKWTTMTIELQWLVHSINDKTKHPLISCSRRLRRLHVEVDESHHHHVFPEDTEMHELAECKLQHTQIVPLRTASLKEHAQIMELRLKDQTRTAFISSTSGGDFIIKMTGGGVLPPFVFEPNRDGKFAITASIDSPEDEKRLDMLTDELKTYVVANRSVYFPKSEDEDKALLKFVKRLLGKKSDKPEHASYSRSLSCIVDIEKFGAGIIRIVDEVGQIVQFQNPSDLDFLKGKRWQEMWFSLRCVYVKTLSAGEMWEVGFSKRFIYMKLQPEYRLDDNVDAAVVTASAPKKARTN